MKMRRFILAWGLKKEPNEFAGDGDISDVPRNFNGSNLSSDDYEGVRDISVLPSSARQKDVPLIES